LIRLILFILTLHITLFASFSAKVVDAKTLKPLKNCMVSDSNHTIHSDAKGHYKIDSKENIYHFKAYGYRPYSFTKDKNTTTIKLRPIRVKALYLTFWGASGNSLTMKRIFNIIDKTKVNAIIVDVKNEYGSTLFKTSFKEANSYGAHKQRTNRNIGRFMKMLKKRDIYSIARIVTFKDEIQASHNTDYAIKNAKGEVWRNHDNMAWVDPFDSRSHDYT